MLKTSVKVIEKGPPWWKSSRYLLAFLAAFGYGCFFLQRVNLSMAIICMVNHTAVDIMVSQGGSDVKGGQNGLVGNRVNLTWESITVSTDANTSLQDFQVSKTDEFESVFLHEAKREDGELVWFKETQGLLLSGLFWGYFVLNLPAQWFIQKTGAKKLALVSVLVMSVLSLLCPVAARTDFWAIMSIRVIQGLATALGVTALYAIWGSWAPLEERSTLLGIVFTGSTFANSIVFPTSGFLCRHGFGGGWPSVFYVYAIIGIVWCILWMFLVFETPESHPRIHPAEREYIESRSAVSSNENNLGSIPWLKLCTSMPVWAVVTSTISYTYPFFMFMAVLPQYMKEILKFDIQSNGIYVMLPYIALYIFCNTWAYVCKVLLTRKLLSVACVRRMSAIIGDVIPCTLYIIISFLDCTQATTAVFLMVLAIGISGANLQCYLVNPYDIAPKYATAIFCISNTISVGTGIISPYVVAALTVNKTRQQWQMAFFSTVGVSIACLLFYLVFGSASEMEWVKNKELEAEIDVCSGKESNETQNLGDKTQRLLEGGSQVENDV